MIKKIQAHVAKINIIIIDDSQRFLVTASDDNLINFWETETLNFIYCIANNKARIKSLLHLKKQRQLFSISTDKKVSIYDLDMIFEIDKLNFQGDAEKSFFEKN